MKFLSVLAIFAVLGGLEGKARGFNKNHVVHKEGLSYEDSNEDQGSGSGAMEPTTTAGDKVIVTPKMIEEVMQDTVLANEKAERNKPVSLKQAIKSMKKKFQKMNAPDVTVPLTEKAEKEALSAEMRGEANKKVALIEGDIALTPRQAMQILTGTKDLKPNGRREIHVGEKWDLVVPYQLPRAYTSRESRNALWQAVDEAIREMQKRTCLSFVERRNDGASDKNKDSKGRPESYLNIIQDKDLCYSWIGLQLQGPQDLSIGQGCERKGTVIHEIMHALGFWHEHTRIDRDKYVTINWQDIEPKKTHNFEKYPHNIDGLDTEFEYDYDSIMHYSKHAFAKNNSRTLITIQPKKAGAVIGQRHQMSETDIKQINKLYCDFDYKYRSRFIEENVHMKKNKYLFFANFPAPVPLGPIKSKAKSKSKAKRVTS